MSRTCTSWRMMTYAMSTFAVRNRKAAYMGNEAKWDINFVWRRAACSFVNPRRNFKLNEKGGWGVKKGARR